MTLFGMTRIADLRISELLTARLCHELIGPVAAVENGVELLLDQPLNLDQEALALAADSARRASARLQFYRFAYGLGGEGRAAGPPPFELAASYFATTRIACHYAEGVRILAPAEQKLGCNLLLVGGEALARGGKLVLDAVGGEMHLDAAGEAARLAPEQLDALLLKTPVEALTPRTVQTYFTGLLARTRGRHLLIEAAEPGRLRVRSAALTV